MRTSSSITSVKPTVKTTAYTAGQCIGGLLKFAGLFDGGRSTGVILDFIVKEKGTQKAAMSVLFFGAKPAGTFTDGVAPTISDADWDLVTNLTSILNGDYTSVDATHQLAAKNPTVVGRGGCDALLAAAGDLYAVVLAGDTPTFGSADAVSFLAGALLDT